MMSHLGIIKYNEGHVSLEVWSTVIMQWTVHSQESLSEGSTFSICKDSQSFQFIRINNDATLWLGKDHHDCNHIWGSTFHISSHLRNFRYTLVCVTKKFAIQWICSYLLLTVPGAPLVRRVTCHHQRLDQGLSMWYRFLIFCTTVQF